MPVTEEIQRKVLEEATSATPNYSIDYNYQRFTDVKDAKADALSDLELTYGGMIGQSDKFYQDQIDAIKGWGDEQTRLQNKQTDFAIEQINQQKDQAHKDYLKEQSASYVDWQKQSNQYGANAEKMASAGLTDTGFAESSQVSMYNTYQNRVAVARESLSRAMLNYDNQIAEARLQNNAALAEIAYQTLQQSLELSLAGFQYKNQLILEQANKKVELDNMYYNRYQDVLEQINHENAVKEDIRQYNETQKWQTEQAEKNREHDKTMAQIEYDYQVKRDEADQKFKAEQAELDRKHDLDVIAANTKAAKEKADHDHKLAMAELEKKHQNDLAILDKQLANEIALLEEKNKPIDVVGGGGSNRTYTTSKSGGSTTRTYSDGSIHGGGGGSFGSTKTTSNTKANFKDSSKLPINKQSLVAIGLAAVSEDKLAKMVASGELITYTKNGQRYFQKNPVYFKDKYSFGK